MITLVRFEGSIAISYQKLGWSCHGLRGPNLAPFFLFLVTSNRLEDPKIYHDFGTSKNEEKTRWFHFGGLFTKRFRYLKWTNPEPDKAILGGGFPL